MFVARFGLPFVSKPLGQPNNSMSACKMHLVHENRVSHVRQSPTHFWQVRPSKDPSAGFLQQSAQLSATLPSCLGNLGKTHQNTHNPECLEKHFSAELGSGWASKLKFGWVCQISPKLPVMPYLTRTCSSNMQQAVSILTSLLHLLG